MNEMTDDLLRTVDRLFEAGCGREARESAEAGVWPAALWQAMQATGLDRAVLAEAAGGPGLAYRDAMAALRRKIGRAHV